jgi:SHS2 domain-containing protein
VIARHAFEDHVSEVRVRLEASSFEELTEEAARAFAELVADHVTQAEDDPEPVILRGRDREGLLVALLDELVYRADAEGRVFPRVEVTRRSDRELDVVLHPARGAQLRSPVKAATYHDLVVRDTADGVTATIVLDV